MPDLQSFLRRSPWYEMYIKVSLNKSSVKYFVVTKKRTNGDKNMRIGVRIYN